VADRVLSFISGPDRGRLSSNSLCIASPCDGASESEGFRCAASENVSRLERIEMKVFIKDRFESCQDTFIG
jgi:hypothetical protein